MPMSPADSLATQDSVNQVAVISTISIKKTHMYNNTVIGK